MKDNVKVIVKTDMPEMGVSNDKKVLNGPCALVAVPDGAGETAVMLTGEFNLETSMNLLTACCRAVKKGLVAGGVSPVIADIAIEVSASSAIKEA